MKEKDATVDYPGQQMVLFVEKEDGSIGTVQTGSYMSKNHMEDYVGKRDRLIGDLRSKLAAQQITPVGFYQVIREMSIADIAARVGISQGKVKRHLEPRHFGAMSLEIARRYAEVFGVPLADFFQMDAAADYLVKGSISHEKTKNPFVCTVAPKRDGE